MVALDHANEAGLAQQMTRSTLHDGSSGQIQAHHAVQLLLLEQTLWL